MSGGSNPQRPYTIELTRTAQRALGKLPKAELKRIDAKILALATSPHPPGSKKLKGVDNLFRIRVGVYRVLYQVQHERLVILVIDVGHRRDIYRWP
jgi:mRNA interferase RelE/StbE